jgi:glycerol-3-phosphate dehydrogenase
MYDVVIIGAGVIGGMIARTLSAYDLKICIAEKKNDVATGASCANSGIVHAGFDAKPGTLKAKLNVKGSEMMPKVAEELGVKYKRNGSLVIGFTEEDRETIKELYERGMINGVNDLKIVEKEDLMVLEPNLSGGVSCALYAPTGGIICPYELTIASIGNAMDNGTDLKLNFDVKKISEKDGYYEVCSDDTTLKAKYVINAAGIYSDHVAKMAGDSSVEVHPRRGEYILLDKECGNLVSHTIFRTPSKMGKGILVTPTVDGNLLTGPTSIDIEDKEDTSTTSAGFEKIITQAKENVPSIPYHKTITSFCGLRAVGSTGDFIINAPKKGFINVAAIESPGLTSAPAIAEYVAELLKEEGAELLPNKDYNPIRKPQHAFKDANIEEKNELIKRDKSFGKVVCRCETITEGEILQVIRINPGARDLDGIKRRTRAQMGRCQGGFCGPQIVEILARELGIPYEQVTKSGEGSYINLGKTKEV